jgi:hypothetical protein
MLRLFKGKALRRWRRAYQSPQGPKFSDHLLFTRVIDVYACDGYFGSVEVATDRDGILFCCLQQLLLHSGQPISRIPHDQQVVCALVYVPLSATEAGLRLASVRKHAGGARDVARERYMLRHRLSFGGANRSDHRHAQRKYAS